MKKSISKHWINILALCIILSLLVSGCGIITVEDSPALASPNTNNAQATNHDEQNKPSSTNPGPEQNSATANASATAPAPSPSLAESSLPSNSDETIEINDSGADQGSQSATTGTNAGFDISIIPTYNGSPYIAVNDNQPYFSLKNIPATAFEQYSPLDELGRVGVAVAMLGQELMPTEERSSISHIEPTAWQSIQYDHISGDYLYNRSHLIGFQLSGENANPQNLLTGTRSLNVAAMLPFENMIADYIQETGHHVYYRVSPIFEGDNLLASGVLLEAQSLEDDDILFNVYCYNAEPGINIDYSSGASSLGTTAVTGSTSQTSNANSTDTNTEGISSSPAETVPEAETEAATEPMASINNSSEPIDGASSDETNIAATMEDMSTSAANSDDTPANSISAESAAANAYVLNIDSYKIHLPSCHHADNISEENKALSDQNIAELIEQGYDPCKVCEP